MENLSLIQANVEDCQQLLASEHAPVRRALLRSILNAAQTQLTLLDPYASETDPQRLREEAARCHAASRRTPVPSLQSALARRALALTQRADAGGPQCAGAETSPDARRPR
jgi:hypothetical protein